MNSWGQTERAVEEAKRESDLRQAFEKYITAMSLAVNGKRVEAIGILESVVQAHPEFVTGMMLLADLYQKLGPAEPSFRPLSEDSRARSFPGLRPGGKRLDPGPAGSPGFSSTVVGGIRCSNAQLHPDLRLSKNDSGGLARRSPILPSGGGPEPPAFRSVYN